MELLASVLLGPRILPPVELPPGSIPPDVTFRSGRLIPRLGGFLSRMAGPAAAVTLGRTIVVHPGTRMTPELLEHELTHVRQWKRDPFFPIRYCLATLRHGYRNNPYEVEARLAAARLGSPTRPSHELT